MIATPRAGPETARDLTQVAPATPPALTGSVGSEPPLSVTQRGCPLPASEGALAGAGRWQRPDRLAGITRGARRSVSRGHFAGRR